MALTYGSRGDDVLEHQKKMKAAGFDPGPLDGIYGTKTKAADDLYKASMQQATASLGGSTMPGGATTQVNPIEGLIGLRSTAERAGANVGWTPETGATLNGAKVDTSGMVNHNNSWYGKPEDVYGLLATSKMPEYQAGGGMFKPEDIQGLVQKILNPQAFTFDASNPMLASMMGQAEQAGAKAFNDNIAGLTGLTGGRLNSWAAGQASQAREGATQAIMPQLYELAYGMWNDQQNRDLTNLNALLGIDETMYGRARDSYGDMRNAGLTGLDIEGTKYNRQVDQQMTNRDIFESDRNYNRDVMESDRDYGLRAAAERRISANSGGSSASADDLTAKGTPEQIDAYYQLLDSFGGGGYGTYEGKASEAYKKVVSNRGKIEPLIGPKLYDQLVKEVKGLLTTVGDAQPVEKEPFDVAKDPIAQRAIDMMGETIEVAGTNSMGAPTMQKKPAHTQKKIAEYVMANVTDDEQLAAILNYLGIPDTVFDGPQPYDGSGYRLK